jgi:hypothetical protein
MNSTGPWRHVGGREMNRELAFAILVGVLCGGAVQAAGWWPFREVLAPSGNALEHGAWRRIWFPFGPALGLFAALCGWVSVEPAPAERLPFGLFLGGLLFAGIFARAVWRALWSLAIPLQGIVAATIGLLRPRIIISRQLISVLDQRALAAALEHERAHARHRDPLRLWLAQLGTDLFWPSPAAAARLRCWRRELELARDEEVRSIGVAGADLAAAILGSLRLSEGSVPTGVAMLGNEKFVKERVARLLQPFETAPRLEDGTLLLLFIVTVALTLAVLAGIQYGEGFVRFILEIV